MWTIPFPVILLSEAHILPVVLVAGHVLVEDGRASPLGTTRRQQSIQDRHRQLPPVVQRIEQHMKALLLDEYNHMGIVGSCVAVPLAMHSVDEALGVFCQ